MTPFCNEKRREPAGASAPGGIADEARRVMTAEQALGRALRRPRYEIIPMRGALEAARALPAHAVVTVTCSPTRGIDATVELAAQVAALGHVAVPHLAARRFASRSHLETGMSRLTEAGVRDVFVVGGDGDHVAGPFDHGCRLIEALAEIAPGLRSVGVPCYPEGHALIAAETLDEALDAKCFLAGHMVTQLCFDAARIRDWLQGVRGRGVDLPMHVGIPGVIERRRLLGIALRIGLGDSTRFLRGNKRMWGRLTGPSQFTPDALLDDLAPLLAAPELNVAGLHINTFNQVDNTEAWRRKRLSTLASTAGDVDASGSPSSAAPDGRA